MDYRSEARAQLRQLAAGGRPFTADDLHAAITHPDQGHQANGRNNVVGQLFREAKAEGWIEPIGVVQSRQPHRKGGMIRVWQGKGRITTGQGSLL
jgi:hypothetical protein